MAHPYGRLGAKTLTRWMGGKWWTMETGWKDSRLHKVRHSISDFEWMELDERVDDQTVYRCMVQQDVLQEARVAIEW